MSVIDDLNPGSFGQAEPQQSLARYLLAWQTHSRVIGSLPPTSKETEKTIVMTVETDSEREPYDDERRGLGKRCKLTKGRLELGGTASRAEIRRHSLHTETTTISLDLR